MKLKAARRNLERNLKALVEKHGVKREGGHYDGKYWRKEEPDEVRKVRR